MLKNRKTSSALAAYFVPNPNLWNRRFHQLHDFGKILSGEVVMRIELKHRTVMIGGLGVGAGLGKAVGKVELRVLRSRLFWDYVPE